MPRLLALIFASLLTVFAFAQGSPFEIAQRIETAFADVETLRMRGDCDKHAKAMGDLAGYLMPLTAPTALGFSPAAKTEYRERLSEATLRGCRRVEQPETVPTASATAPPPRTATADSLQMDFMGACGRDFEPARARYIAALDRAMSITRDPEERAELSDRIRSAQAVVYRPCNQPSATGPVPMETVRLLTAEMEQACGDHWSVLRLRLLAALDAAISVEGNDARARDLGSARTALLRRDPPPCVMPKPVTAADTVARDRYAELAVKAEEHLAAARSARTNGNCAAFRARRSSANFTLGMMRGTKYIPPQPDPLVAAIAELGTLVCPAPRRPEIAACANTYKSHREANLPMTCRCNGPTQLLMTWGTEIYMRGSTICNAAIHVGALPVSGIGTVRLIPVPRAGKPEGTTRNGITTNSYFEAIIDGFGVTPVAE